jgi:hypothetical protein
MARRKQQIVHSCPLDQSNRNGSLISKLSISPVTKRFDCLDSDWNTYLTQGWDNVVWNKEPEAWAEELDQAGCGQVELPDPSMGDLDNQVHPIFARLNWVQGFSNDLWAVFLPSLRLASKMVLSEPALAFFRRVQFGVEKKTNFGRTYLDYIPPQDARSENAEVRSSLDALSCRLQLLFAATPSEESTRQIHAAHCVSHLHFGRDYFIRGEISSLPEDDGQFQYLLINQAYADYLTSYTRKLKTGKSTSPSDFVRTTFCLAASLVHEIGHAFYARDRMSRNEDYTEPFFDLAQHNPEPELGYALEYALFGVSINACIHPEHGVALEWQPIVKQQVGDCVALIDENHLNFPIDPRWMYSLLKKSFWDQVERESVEEQLRALMVPTDVSFGATLDLRTRHWVWRKRKTEITRFGKRLNGMALAKKVKALKQRKGSVDKTRIVRGTAGISMTRAKKAYVRKVALLETSVAAGELIT